MKTYTGSQPYQGYEYQILVTVWVGLELLFHNKLAKAVVIEPASGEDIAVELDVDPERAASTLQVDNEHKQFEIQIKLRQSGHWTKGEFANIVQGKKGKIGARGPKQWTNPIDFLMANSNTKFILLTNAQVSGPLRAYLINSFLELSTSSIIPGEPEASDSQKISPRICIMHQYETERLTLEIDHILSRYGHVPPANHKYCLKKMKEAVRARLLGRIDSTWTQEEIIATMEDYGGFPVLKSPYLVKPINYDEILRKITEDHKIIISGPPGTGKTFLAEHIANLHRLMDEPFEIITEEVGVVGIKKRLDQDYKYLFLINDPWGYYKLSEDADRWSSELPKLFNSASVHKRFIVTSRIGIKQQAIRGHEISELSSSEILLAEDHYNDNKLNEILEHAIKGSKPWQQDLVRVNRAIITGKLKIPYSIVVLANKVTRSPSPKEIDIQELINQSNIEVIGSNLAQEINEMGKDFVASSIILWALMMSYPFINGDIAGKAGRIIRDTGYQRSLDTQKMFRWLLDAKWLQQKSDGFTAHPTVLGGLESLIDREPSVTEEALIALLNALALKKKAKTAHKIIKQLKGRNLPIPDVVHNGINLYLLDRLKAATGLQYNEAFRDLGQWSTGIDPVSEIVRLLSKRKKVKYAIGNYEWPKPNLSQDEIRKIGTSVTAHECAARFIQEVLPSNYGGDAYKANELVSFFNALGWDMSDSFLIAAEKALEFGSHVSDVLVEGALFNHPNKSERLLNAALSAYDEASEWLNEFQKEIRKANQAELDVAHANHVIEEPSERFYPIDDALKTIVFLRRNAEGYKWIKGHNRCSDLLESWVSNIDDSTSAEEVGAILRMCPASNKQLGWKAVQKAHLPEFAPELIQALKISPEDQIKLCLEVLSDLLTLNQWKESVVPVILTLPFVRKAAIWQSAKGLNNDLIRDASEIVQIIESTMNADEVLCLSLCYKVDEQNHNLLNTSNEAIIPLLRELANSTNGNLSISAIFVLSEMKHNFSMYLPALFECEYFGTRINALRLAYRLENESGKNLLRLGLNDQDYHCRREAMMLLSISATKTDKKLISEKIRDPSAPVREACAKIIGDLKWTEAQSLLIKLLSDRRDASQDHLFKFHVPNYHVARTAAFSLGELGKLSRNTIDQLLDFIRKRNPKKDDLIVIYHLIDALGSQDGHNVLLFIEEFIDDIWHMPGIKSEGFPLRYAAAWGIFRQLIEDESVMEITPIEKISRGAIHTDGRLAGPCLLCLGLLGKRTQNKIIYTLQSDSMTHERALLILNTLPNECQYTKDKLIEFIGPSHPALTIFEIAEKSPSISEQEWGRFLKENAPAAKWLDRIRSTEDVNAVVQFLLNTSYKEPVCDKFLNLIESRKHELAEAIPIMTTRSMFGGE